VSDKTEWPTSDRILELRDKGIVSYSNTSALCVVIATLVCIFLAGGSVTEDLRKLFLSKLEFSQLAQYGILIRDLLIKLLLIPVLIVAVTILLWGFAQTRFLFRINLASLDLSRLSFKSPWTFAGIAARIGYLQISLVAVVLGMLALFRIVGVRFYSLLHDDSVAGAKGIISDFNHFLPILLLVFILLAAVMLMFEKLRFAMNNRMTRKEVLEDQQGA
jgi:flagellar biosynthesis protein FlhB